MSSLDGEPWNYYTAVLVEPTRVQVFPGAGGYTQEEVRAYLERYIADNSTKSPDVVRTELAKYWSNVPYDAGLASVQANDHLGLGGLSSAKELVCLFWYKGEDDVLEAVWKHFRNLGSPMHLSLGMTNDTSMFMAADSLSARQEMLGSFEMRVSLLMEETCFDRDADPLWPAKGTLLEQYVAAGRNIEALMTLALSPAATEEARHDASYLTFQLIAHLRPDLFKRAEEFGVPHKGDPWISWNSRTSDSKGW